MITDKAKSRFTCIGCGVRFESGGSQRLHFKTEWHLYNLKRKVCNLEPVNEEKFKEIQLVLEAEPKSDSDKLSITPTNDDQDPVSEDDSDWDDITEEEMLARVVPDDVCLFCNKKNNNIVNNLKHMNSYHGFFIPEEQYLIDCEGLMEYLGFKVGAGATCLWCNKEFKSVHGVRLHMTSKDHCKIYYDQDKALDEFKEFYDYSGQVQIEMKKPSELMIRKSKRTTHDSRSMQLVKPNTSKQLMAKSTQIPMYQKKAVKRFDAYRAKILLRTGMANNDTKRSRLRLQNPM